MDWLKKMWIDWRNYGMTIMYCTLLNIEKKKQELFIGQWNRFLTHFRLCDDAADKKLKETTMATAGRFAALNSEEKDAVLDNINAKNTKRQTANAYRSQIIPRVFNREKYGFGLWKLFLRTAWPNPVKFLHGNAQQKGWYV